MKKLLLLSIFIVLWSCDFSIPPVNYHFYNQSSLDLTVEPTPQSEEYWQTFDIANTVGHVIIESVDVNIDFIYTDINGTINPVLLANEYETGLLNTFIFYDIDTGWTIP